MTRRLRETGSNSLSREMLARIVRALADGHPRAVALDIALLDPRAPEADARARRCAKSTEQRRRSDRSLWRRAHSQADSLSRANWPSRRKPSEVLWPIDAIRDAAHVGLANVSTDASGIPRYIPMIYQIPDGVIPSFALAAASAGAWSGTGLRSRQHRTRGPNNENRLGLPHGRPLLRTCGKLQAHQRR